MSELLSTSLHQLAGDITSGSVSPDFAGSQLRLMAQIALLLEQEVNAFRMLEQDRQIGSGLENEAMQKLHETARLPEPPLKLIRGEAEVIPLRPSDTGASPADTVVCPVTGNMARDVCLNWQRRPLSATSSAAVRMYQACRSGCSHSRLVPGDQS